MICPKCRKKYPDGVTVCPDCEVELFGLMGSADAPMDDGAAVQDLFEEVVVDETDEYSPIVYKVADPKKKEPEAEEEVFDDYETAVHQGNGLAVFMLVIALLFLAASGVMFFLGKKPVSTETVGCISNAVLNLLN